MITPFFRSSLLNTLSLCELRMFLEYSVGYRGESNLAALTGSTVHGVMEVLALYKLALQNDECAVVHDSFGCLTTQELAEPENILIEKLLRISYDYYDKENPGIFIEDSYKECLKLVNQALSHCNGAFDPRSYNMYAAELPFEIELKDPWAAYSYESPNGLVTGQLCLKGTIDVVYQEDANTLHCLDYKTSKAANCWATGKTKVADRIPKDPSKETSLYNDQQMMLYYYVLAHKFPDKDIIMTLYFIRINKAFTLIFDRKKDLPRIHNWLRERFEYIKSVEIPTWIDGTENGWKCRFCPHNKNKQSGTKLSICRFFQNQFKKKSMDEIMVAHTDYNQLHSYGAGGSSSNRE